jgi:hypothetical protein
MAGPVSSLCSGTGFFSYNGSWFSGSFLEFLGILSALQEKYKPSDLPYHIIIPSLPGYAFSDTPPLNRDWRLEDSAGLLHKLMCGLGFEAGYAVQGGDIGSYTARIMAGLFESCKGLRSFFLTPDLGTNECSALHREKSEGSLFEKTESINQRCSQFLPHPLSR